MIKKIKITLIVIAIISGAILAIMLLQDRTKKLEDRSYNEINNIVIASDKANINFYKSDDEKVRVVIYGSSKDFSEIVEGTRNISISKMTGDTKCILNCKNEVNIYLPDNQINIAIKIEKGNIYSETYIHNIKIVGDSGNISLDKVDALSITTNSGNVNIKEISANNNSSIKTEIGNIYIDKLINMKIDAKSESGSVVVPYIKEEQEFTLKLETNKGNVDINSHENKSE